MALKKWEIASCDAAAARALAGACGVPALTAALLQARGCTTPAQAQALLGEAPLGDPCRLRDMDAAVACVQRALDDFACIAVYGDYDADGVTATALLYSYLESCGARVQYCIPEREGEGYGLSSEAVQRLHSQGVQLLITVDNGISALEEVAQAKALGMQVVVTDHHRPRPTLPPADAVVDPFRPDGEGAYQELCGVGVAFKLVQALEGPQADVQGLLENYADLLAIGTIADMVPLTGENRSFVKCGLRMLPCTDRPGLQSLLQQAGLAGGRPLNAQDVAFSLAPRLNAAGRLGSPTRAVQLLLSEDPAQAQDLAADICADNDSRRDMEKDICRQALAQLQGDPARCRDRVLVVEGKGWHHGVIGIVASRVTALFGKPCMVFSVDGEEARGSGRSVQGFSLFEAVASCAALLDKFGGHPMAAGVSLKPANLPAFRERINAFAAAQGAMPVPALRLDGALKAERLSLGLLDAAALLEPFGTGNPQPLYALLDLCLQQVQPLKEGQHLRLCCAKGQVQLQCLCFHTTLQDFPYQPGQHLDLAVELSRHEFRGRESLNLVVRAYKLAGSHPEELAAGQALFDRALAGEPLGAQELARLSPDRDCCAAFYRKLRGAGGYTGGAAGLAALAGLPLERALSCLQLFAEHGLAQYSVFADRYTVQLQAATGKVDLLDSGYLRQLRVQAS